MSMRRVIGLSTVLGTTIGLTATFGVQKIQSVLEQRRLERKVTAFTSAFTRKVDALTDEKHEVNWAVYDDLREYLKQSGRNLSNESLTRCLDKIAVMPLSPFHIAEIQLAVPVMFDGPRPNYETANLLLESLIARTEVISRNENVGIVITGMLNDYWACQYNDKQPRSTKAQHDRFWNNMFVLADKLKHSKDPKDKAVQAGPLDYQLCDLVPRPMNERGQTRDWYIDRITQALSFNNGFVAKRLLYTQIEGDMRNISLRDEFRKLPWSRISPVDFVSRETDIKTFPLLDKVSQIMYIDAKVHLPEAVVKCPLEAIVKLVSLVPNKDMTAHVWETMEKAAISAKRPQEVVEYCRNRHV